MYRCETCKTVFQIVTLPSGRVLGGHNVAGHCTRELTTAETARYVQMGHEAFGDMRAVKDAAGNIVRYE